VLAAAAIIVSGVSASSFMAPDGPIPPTSESLRNPSQCSCDFCMSESRIEPTSVSTFKCVPSQPGTCKAEAGVIPGDPVGGVPYELFCVCHCQPLQNEEETQCTAFNAQELLVAGEGGDGGCSDPKLPSQIDQDKMADALAAAKEAKMGAARVASKLQQGQLGDARRALAAARVQGEHAAVASQNTKMLYDFGNQGFPVS